MDNDMDNDMNDNSFEKYEIDMYLFYDLYHISEYIIKICKFDAIYVLVGDTPSYLKPYLEHRKKTVYNLSISNKPFSCIYYENNTTDTNDTTDDVDYLNYFMPSVKNQKAYFNYLNTKTLLTKEYVKKNWNNIVLIDSSSGASISGVSIFFNRYVENIPIKNKCKDMGDSVKPLKFIRLVENFSMTNVDPVVHKQYFNSYNHNYDPKIIILISHCNFLFREIFMICEEYDRYLPFYSHQNWHTSPENYIEKNEYNRSIDNFEKIKKILNLLDNYKKNEENNNNITEFINFLKTMSYTKKHANLVKKINNRHSLKKFLNLIYEYCILLKYSELEHGEFKKYILNGRHKKSI
jgi:hypothetical protein